MINLTNDFTRDTEFINNEFMKMRQVYGVDKISTKMLNKISNSIWSHFRMISDLDKRKTKFMIKVEWAKFTMPHSRLWKICHSRLWAKVKEELEKEKNAQTQDLPAEIDTSQDLSLVPQPTVSVDLNALSYPSTLVDR